MKFVFLLLLTMLPLAAQNQAQVRVVTIEKSGATTSLESAVPGCDDALFAALMTDAATGRAKTVHDQVVVVRGGQRSKVESVREFPYPTQADAEPSEWYLYPYSFIWQYLGQTLEAEVTVGEKPPGEFGKHIIDVNLAPGFSALLAMHPWPVPDFRGSGQMGRVLRPVVATHRLTAQVITWTGRTVLLSVAPSPQAALTEGSGLSFRYTFLRAGVDGEKPSPPDVNPPKLEWTQRRLHAVTIRLPRDEAAALMLHQSGEDSELYYQLCRRVAAGTAALSGHTAVLCRRNQRSKVESFAAFPVPGGKRDLIPLEWSPLSPGSELEVEDEGDEPGDQWSIDLSSREAPELIPYHPDAKHPELHGAVAECLERKFTGPLRIPSSGVLCSGLLSTSPATDGEEAPDGLTDVCFLLQSPPPGKPDTESQPHILLQNLLLSVPAAEGPALVATLNSGEATALAGTLIERLTAGEISCAAHLALVMRNGHRSHTSCVRWVQQPGKFHPSKAVPELTLGSSWSTTACGLKLEAEYRQGAKDLTINGTLEWDTAPVTGFGEPGATIPKISARRCTQKVELKMVSLQPGQPFIADVRASNAREGTPEHGRWHVLVLLAR